MKNFFITTFAFLLFHHADVHAQSISSNISKDSRAIIELSVLKNSDSPLTTPEHVYLLQASNKSSDDIVVKITATNIVCAEKTNIAFEHSIFQYDAKTEEASTDLEKVKVPANGKVEFFLKLINTSQDKQNSWNCTEVMAIGENKNILSNSILIETFNPNPKDFR